MRLVYAAAVMVSMLASLDACAPAMVTAQASPDSIQHRNDCRLAEQVLRTGHPAPREDWALAMIWTCAQSGPAVAEALSVARASSDTAYLNALTSPLIRLRDGSVFAAALTLAGDRGASVPARVAALRALMYAVRPGGYVDFASLGSPQTINCFGTSATDSRVLNGAPLPANHVESVGVLADGLQKDASEPDAIRSAANCAMLLVRSIQRRH